MNIKIKIKIKININNQAYQYKLGCKDLIAWGGENYAVY